MLVKNYEGQDKTRQDQLTLKLAKASDAYYAGLPIMEDAVFDGLMEELQELERASGFAWDISPTIKVGGDVVSGLTKVRHEDPALSLDKVKYKDRETLKDWLGDRMGALSWKMDGLTLVLTYENGSLVRAVTRGNGEVGEDVTHNARFFDGIPLTIPFKGHLTVRGEAVMSQAEFDRVNEMAGGQYENARNLASSTVRLMDSFESRTRHISFFAFDLVRAEGEDIVDALHFIHELGIQTVFARFVDKSHLLDSIEEFRKEVPSYPFPTDGLVLTFADRGYALSLGTTGHHPRGSIALKWTDEFKETTIRDIEWSVGKTGVITPVAIFDPVRLGLGSTIKRASLHNISICQNMADMEDMTKKVVCGTGSKVRVILANMIIPQVIAATEGTIDIPDVCPVCGKPLTIKDDGRVKTLWCLDKACPVKMVKRFAGFASRDGMDIVGLSEKKIEQLINGGYIRELADLFTLSDKADRLSAEDGWGKASVKVLLDAVEKARKTDLRHFLYSLQIPLVGHDLSGKLDKVFKGRLSELMAFIEAPDIPMLSEVDGIGPVKAGSFGDYVLSLKDPAKRAAFDRLISQLSFEEPAEDAGAKALEGKTFVVTGKVFKFPNRDALKAFIEAKGGKVSGSVSKKTDFLINNDVSSTSGKNKKAKELGIPVISEDQFLEMC